MRTNWRPATKPYETRKNGPRRLEKHLKETQEARKQEERATKEKAAAQAKAEAHLFPAQGEFPESMAFFVTKVGAYGYPGNPDGSCIRVVQVIDDRRALIQLRDLRTLRASRVVLWKGKTEGWTDGQNLDWSEILQRPARPDEPEALRGNGKVYDWVVISGTHRYKTTSGGSKTVLVFERMERPKNGKR